MPSDAPAHTTRTCTRNPPAHTKKNGRWAEGLPVEGNVHHRSFSIRPANDSCKG